jgi:hypothetical protein
MMQTEGSKENEEGFLCQSEPLFPSLSSVKDFFRDSRQKIFARCERRLSFSACSHRDASLKTLPGNNWERLFAHEYKRPKRQ